MNDLEHPDITSALLTGYPTWIRPEREPRCPCCGSECDTVYVDRQGEIFGCECCVATKDPWDVDECFDEDDGYDEYAWQERKELYR